MNSSRITLLVGVLLSASCVMSLRAGDPESADPDAAGPGTAEPGAAEAHSARVPGRVRIFDSDLTSAETSETPGYVRIIDSWSTSPDEVFRPVTFQEAGPASVAAPIFQGNVNRGRLLFGSPSRSRSLLSTNRRALSQQPGTSVVLGTESRGRQTTDVGQLLGKSSSSLGIATEKRSPIVTDVRVRGSQVGQLLASGSYWFPVRSDLDTLLSKIDSSIVEDVIVIKGPYASRYGPGYSFIDFDLKASPRFENGFEVHGSSSLNYSTNGEQWNGRQTFWGGDEDYGFRIGYGLRSGVDYETGDGIKLPSSYKSGDLDFAFGFDLDDNRSLEFQYLRLDQSDVQLPNQINVIDFLATDSYEVTYTERDGVADLLVFETWFNLTRLQGDSQDSGKRAQIPELDAGNFINSIEGWNTSTGYNLGLTWELDGDQSLTLGTDFRYLMGELNEFGTADFFFNPAGPGAPPISNFQVPSSYQANPGIYVEHVNPVTSRLTVRTGGRFDWVNMNAETDIDGAETFGDPLDVFVGGAAGVFDQSFELGQGYVTADYQASDYINLNGGLGFGMRAPTMAEMYSNGTFSVIMPQFAFAAPFGNPLLKPEKRYQVDLGMTYDDGQSRGGVNAYHAWIIDYITLDGGFGNVVGSGFQPAYGYTNTDLATLAGFEAFAEQDLNTWFTAFGNLSYTEGRDHRRNGTNYPFSFATFTANNRSNANQDEEPLYAIFPLEARVGLRLTEPTEARWGLEFSARIVDNQDRVARTLLETETSGFTTYDLRGFLQATDAMLLVAGVENLTDKNYQEHLDPRNLSNVFRPGINYYFGAELTY